MKHRKILSEIVDVGQKMCAVYICMSHSFAHEHSYIVFGRMLRCKNEIIEIPIMNVCMTEFFSKLIVYHYFLQLQSNFAVKISAHCKVRTCVPYPQIIVHGTDDR